MNIHPLLVHFPIALFVVYALIEIIGLDRKFPSLKNGKRLLAVLSFISGWVTYQTGQEARELLGNNLGVELQKIVVLHENMALIFVLISGLLALGAFVGWQLEKNALNPQKNWRIKIASHLSFLTKRPVQIILAIIGLGLVTVVGGLGGLIVYGPTLDPVTKLLYQIVTGN